MVLIVEVRRRMFLKSGIRTCINMRQAYPMLKTGECKARRVLKCTIVGGAREGDVSYPERQCMILREKGKRCLKAQTLMNVTGGKGGRCSLAQTLMNRN